MKYDFIIKSGFVILITAIAIIVLSDFVQGSNLLETDDFTGTDGDPPDPGIWSVYNRDTNDYVRLEENTLRIHTVNGGVSRAISINELDVHNFTVLVDWRMETQTGRLADLRIYSNSSGTPKSWMGLYYDGDWHGWGFESRYLGNWKYTSTYNRNAVGGEWYAFNIFNVTVVRKSTSTTIYQRTGLPIDPFIGAASIHIGVGTSQNSMQPRVNYDSYRFYDNDKRPNIGPIWLSEPQLNAVEDVPIIFDFSRNWYIP